MKAIPILLLSCACTIARSQSAYTFTHDTVPFLTLLTGLPCPLDGNDEHVFTELDGETFHFFGRPFTFDATHQILAGDMGFLRVRNDTAHVLIDALHTPLHIADPGSAIVYLITGPPGDRVLVVEWRDWGLDIGPQNNIGSFQIAVHQATGVIELRYGTSTIDGTLLFDDSSGPLAGVAFVNSALTACDGKLWVEQNALAPTLDSLPDLDLDGLHNVPATQAVYRFTPRADVAGVDEVPQASMLQASISDQGDRMSIHLADDEAGGLLCLFDAMGRPVQQWRATAADMVLPTGELASGAYVLQYLPMEGPWAVLRFVR